MSLYTYMIMFLKKMFNFMYKDVYSNNNNYSKIVVMDIDIYSRIVTIFDHLYI